MKKENIFDLYAAQHKDEPAHAAERVLGEVTPEDVAPAPEVKAPEPAPEPKRETPPELPLDPEPENKEGGNSDVI